MAETVTIQKRVPLSGAKRLGLTIGKDAVVEAVAEGLPGAHAGVEVGWTVKSVEGKPVRPATGPAAIAALQDAMKRLSIISMTFTAPAAAPTPPMPPMGGGGALAALAGGARSQPDDTPLDGALPRTMSMFPERGSTAAAAGAFVQFFFRIDSFVFASPKHVPSLLPKFPKFQVRWERGHNADGTRRVGQTDWEPIFRDPDTAENRVEWQYGQGERGEGMIACLHVPVAGEKGKKKMPPKQMKLSLWMSRTPQTDTTHEQCSKILDWPLKYTVADDGRWRTGSLTVRQDGMQEAIGRMNLAYRMDRLDPDCQIVRQAREERRLMQRERSATREARSGVGVDSALGTYVSTTEREPRRGSAEEEGSGAEEPAPVAAPAPPPPPPAEPGEEQLAFLQEQLKMQIYRSHSQLHQLAARVRQKRRDAAEIARQRQVLCDDLQHLRAEIGHQVQNREHLQQCLADERERTQFMRFRRGNEEEDLAAEKDDLACQTCSLQ